MKEFPSVAGLLPFGWQFGAFPLFTYPVKSCCGIALYCFGAEMRRFGGKDQGPARCRRPNLPLFWTAYLTAKWLGAETGLDT